MKPTQPGWYWFRWNTDETLQQKAKATLQLVIVCHDSKYGELCVHGWSINTAGNRSEPYHWSSQLRLVSDEAVWQGPLNPPYDL